MGSDVPGECTYLQLLNARKWRWLQAGLIEMDFITNNMMSIRDRRIRPSGRQTARPSLPNGQQNPPSSDTASTSVCRRREVCNKLAIAKVLLGAGMDVGPSLRAGKIEGAKLVACSTEGTSNKDPSPRESPPR
jgi:hypothetical protein